MRNLPAYVVVVTGSRHWTDRAAIRRELMRVQIDAFARNMKVVLAHGAATGADAIAKEIAEEMGFEVHAHIANWRTLGKKAGPLRNAEMLKIERPRVVLAFPMSDSVGTYDCIRKARAMDKPPELRIIHVES